VSVTPDVAFLRAIIESPDDDTPRLIYADWLEEHDQPERAEFIRVQCELAKLPDESPRRQGLQAVERKLLGVHREDWVQHLGVAMTWEDALSLFRWRLAQAVAWCRDRDVRSLRTLALKPAVLWGWERTASAPTVWRSLSAAEGQTAVNALANRRAELLAGEVGHAWASRGGLAGGRLLLFDPEGTLSDEAAEANSEGYFDANNIPAWDAWVWYAEEPAARQGDWTMWSSYLVAWVPPRLVELADGGIRVNPEQCIEWASEVDTSLTRRLRAAGLLA
jgi:uncharacterized protein (TIGR02996 family)